MLEQLESRQLMTADLSGTVYHDQNANGVREQGENGLVNWMVYLDQNQSGTLDASEQSAITDADGHYQFRGLVAGDYRVAEVVRAGWGVVDPASGYTDVTLTDGDSARVDFLNQGSVGTGAITGNVWRDVNNDQVKDLEDTPLAGWTIFLDLNGNKGFDIDEPFALTNGNGDYTISGILGGAPGSPKSYEVTEDVPTGWEPANVNQTAEVVEGQTTVMPDFSNWPDPDKLTTVSGTVWNDVNGDGAMSGTEVGLSGWTVFADLNLNGSADQG